jgi:hypothetical protein
MFTENEKVFSINLHHHPGFAGIVTGISLFNVCVDLQVNGRIIKSAFDFDSLLSLETPPAEYETRIFEMLRQKGCK